MGVVVATGRATRGLSIGLTSCCGIDVFLAPYPSGAEKSLSRLTGDDRRRRSGKIISPECIAGEAALSLSPCGLAGEGGERREGEGCGRDVRAYAHRRPRDSRVFVVPEAADLKAFRFELRSPSLVDVDLDRMPSAVNFDHQPMRQTDESRWSIGCWRRNLSPASWRPRTMRHSARSALLISRAAATGDVRSGHRSPPLTLPALRAGPSLSRNGRG